MDAALGPPAAMADRRDDLTPMMQQYVDCCARYDDSLVLFQVGDFYEAFCEAAESVSRLCELTLTKREDSTGSYPMTGIPVDNAASYIDTLLDAGYRIAVADQVQDPAEATGVVDRAVTRIVTPGTLTEDELLKTVDSNYVACLTRGVSPDDGGDEDYRDGDDGEYGLAMLDVSTGEFVATSACRPAVVHDEVERFAPAEAIVGPAATTEFFDDECMVSPYDPSAFEAAAARERVAAYFGDPADLLAGPAEVRACGALLAYAEYTRGGEDGHLDYLNHLTRYDPREYMLLDAVALRSLELFERRAVHGAAGTALVDVLDETACALGSRRLKAWLRRPLVDREPLERRLDAVEELIEGVKTREGIHDYLRSVYDLERLIGRVSRGRANARDLRSLLTTLDVVPALVDELADVDCEKLRELRAGLDEMADVRDLIGRAIREDPPIEITEGSLIQPGYRDELDELRATERSGKRWIDDLEAAERERTGIDSLKVGYNRVHGYYIEVTDPNLDRVPAEYTRRQTLKNAERFYTPELKQREDEIVRATQRADDLEHRLFREVRTEVAAESERVQALAATLSELDVLVALAEVAARYDYARPGLGGDGIHVVGGRHPVVERTRESFVPNDVHLDEDGPFAVITGPNMSGKSTYMRQVALAVVMAQIGSFVPAASARIELVDRVFTRIGASDDIAGGRSTFMVEMTELADILGGATERSLVLLDEVGRGTSTADGLAIAQAVTEYIHDEVGAWTLFATHHHELTAVADELDGVYNCHFDADQRGEEVVFEHEVSPGPATASYGVEVAGDAGIPDAVVERSRKLLVGTETASDGERDSPAEREKKPPAAAGTEPTGDEAAGTVAAELRAVNLADTTPLEALTLLHRLRDRLED